jgi:iron(III) transport system ATP-binding protein
VFRNVAFPLEGGMPRRTKKEIAEKVDRALAAVALEELSGREAMTLSGVQQQRLALARAIVTEPALLLLDEPLSRVDTKLRERTRFELKRLLTGLGATTVYVTHDQEEALALSHEIAVMDQGCIIQRGTPRDIYETPRNRFVADFVGTTNLLEGTAVGADRIQTAVGTLKVSGGLAKGAKAVISVRPEDVELHTRLPEGLAGANVARATVDSRAFVGEHVDVLLKVNESLLHARAHPSLRAEAGSEIYVVMRAEKCVAIA